ncbi:MAG: thermonuclease family protein [Alcaligenaceae bacterium]|nr:thermonuclease family protein [Alcaligenaceae bacterium SAGV5]MPS53727.1 thermonuclease family protein [Alcaligenaceae bacterium SAGV3]MPT59961.1 thermonuclease family protein [Alcaligenaceae bacterium]
MFHMQYSNTFKRVVSRSSFIKHLAGGLALALPGIVLAQVCTVTSVHDGDTMRLMCPSQKKSMAVRLERIDAPEIGQAGGIASRDFLRALCPVGSQARLSRHGKDRYGRTLGDVDCGHGSVQDTMLRHGQAWVYPKFITQRALVDLQGQAKAGRRGLWALPAPVAPWEYRRRDKRL